MLGNGIIPSKKINRHTGSQPSPMRLFWCQICGQRHKLPQRKTFYFRIPEQSKIVLSSLINRVQLHIWRLGEGRGTAYHRRGRPASPMSGAFPNEGRTPPLVILSPSHLGAD